ncbi:MAG TPA: S41 family peptidase, partial [Elusimicrobiales bacterium]|nr:S41 family peptidase [Elusimicrobiales bacterium]
YKNIKLLVNIVKLISENYVEEIKEEKLVYGAARGMVSQLDGFSVFMEPKMHKRISGDIEGEFGGVGIFIPPAKRGTKYITVISPVPNSPAYEAGVLPEDKIISIEGKTTQTMSVNDAIDMLRGKPGTKVTFTIIREVKDKNGKGGTLVRKITVKRRKIKTRAMQSKMINENTAYIHLDDFSGYTAENVLKELKKFEKQGMEGLVLDLRYNPGGLLFAAIDIVKFFVGDKKMVVYTKGRKKENYQEFKADSNAPFEDLPIVVLVNDISASGSEIVAGALQDHKRAVIIGSRTFGKGSVQSVIPLSDGSGLSLTVAKYYTPLGRSIHRGTSDDDKIGGIEPDIKIEVSPNVAFKVLQQYNMVYTPGKKPSSAVKKEDQVADEILDRAVEMLKAGKIFSGREINKKEVDKESKVKK